MSGDRALLPTASPRQTRRAVRALLRPPGRGPLGEPDSGERR
ncbi:MAG: hypothetical protein ACRD0K_00210 [Egibacteraceae bacterium]